MKSYIIYIYFMLGLLTITQTHAQTFHAIVFAGFETVEKQIGIFEKIIF